MDPNKIQSKEEFVDFIYQLRDGYRMNPPRWQNDTIESFLGGMAGWVEDLEGAYRFKNEAVPVEINWNFIARLLAAAAVYD